MPPITNRNSAATAHTSFRRARARPRTSAGRAGPTWDARQVMYTMARHSSMAPRMPGRIPAMKSLPMLVSVKTP